MKGYDPPYMPNTETRIIELVNEGHFVRVYDKINSPQRGGWCMIYQDIVGLTPDEIQDKYALSFKPIYVCDVILQPKAEIRCGRANSLYGFRGKGLQFDLMDERIGIFANERKLVEE